MIAYSKIHTTYCKCLQFKLLSIYYKVLKSCSHSVVTKKINGFQVEDFWKIPWKIFGCLVTYVNMLDHSHVIFCQNDLEGFWGEENKLIRKFFP